MRLVDAALLCEATRVALAEGVRLERLDVLDPLDMLPTPEGGVARALAALDAVAAGSKKGRSGMWRDIKMKGRKSESDYITGDVVRRGAARGVPTPVNAGVLDLIAEIEGGQRPMALANFAVLAPLAEAWAAGMVQASGLKGGRAAGRSGLDELLGGDALGGRHRFSPRSR